MNLPDESEDTEGAEEEKQMFLNPLLAMKKKKKRNGEDESSEWSDDDKYEPKETKEEKKAKKEKERKTMLGKRKKTGGIEADMDAAKDFFNCAPVEEVPQTDLEKKGPNDLPDGYSSMDSDDIAETRALAK